MDIRITKAKVKNHWHYSWWKYAAIAVVCTLVVNLIFTMTAYRPPANRKIEMYLCNGYADATKLHADLWPAFQEAAPDQELLTLVNIDMTGDDVYSNMQFTTYIGAQQGDLLLLPVSSVKKLVLDGADNTFLDLSEYLESGELDVPGVDLSAGMLPTSDGGTSLFAIPADSLYGLTDFTCNPAGSMLCVMGYTMNPENAVGMINLLFDRYQTEKPDWYDQAQEAQAQEAAQETQLFR